MRNKLRLAASIWTLLVCIGAVLHTAGCSTLATLGVDDAVLVSGVQAALAKHGLAGAATEEQVREVLAIVAADARLREIAEEVGSDARVRARIEELVAKYVRAGKVVDEPPTEGEPGQAIPEDRDGDAVEYSALEWAYGGFDGSGAWPDKPEISALVMTPARLSFRYVADLAAWGKAPSDHTGALACLFVKGADGRWRGGKFDWISSSRSSRGLENVFDGYGGWTLSGVPNPCEVAYVIVRSDRKARTNVIAGTWQR